MESTKIVCLEFSKLALVYLWSLISSRGRRDTLADTERQSSGNHPKRSKIDAQPMMPLELRRVSLFFTAARVPVLCCARHSARLSLGNPEGRGARVSSLCFSKTWLRLNPPAIPMPYGCVSTNIPIIWSFFVWFYISQIDDSSQKSSFVRMISSKLWIARVYLRFLKKLTS